MTSPLLKVLSKHSGRFGRIVPFNPDSDRLLPLDFTETNKELSPSLINDTAAFSEWVGNSLHEAGATYGIGGYAEHRTIYTRSALFNGEEEPRRLHLGTDILGRAGTIIHSPLDAMVHSFADNAAPCDYGGTIILQHDLDEVIFYTLYGHLSLQSLDGLYPGKPISKGEAFATFGIASENGNWPPHLHFQLIQVLQGRRGDYPGVCRFSEKEAWLRNSPNPDFILQLNKYVRS